MSLFDPYSYTRINELRQEQLALKARRQSELGLDAPLRSSAHQSTSALVRSLTSRFGRGAEPAAPASVPAAKGRPAMDS